MKRFEKLINIIDNASSVKEELRELVKNALSTCEEKFNTFEFNENVIWLIDNPFEGVIQKYIKANNIELESKDDKTIMGFYHNILNAFLSLECRGYESFTLEIKPYEIYDAYTDSRAQIRSNDMQVYTATCVDMLKSQKMKVEGKSKPQKASYAYNVVLEKEDREIRDYIKGTFRDRVKGVVSYVKNYYCTYDEFALLWVAGNTDLQKMFEDIIDNVEVKRGEARTWGKSIVE